MKITRKVFASIVTLLAACLVHAADTKSVTRVIAIQDVATDDAPGYATMIAKVNEAAKTKLGVDSYYHIYSSVFDGERSGSVRSVVAAESVAALTKNATALENDPGLAEIRERMRTIRKLGGRTLYQALRFEGTHKNASVFTTTAMVSDEAGYLKALDGLRALFDNHSFQDAKISAYRVLAGRTNHTHRITIALPSKDRLAALLDFLASDAQMAEWLASAAKYRTVVGNTTANEITK